MTLYFLPEKPDHPMYSPASRGGMAVKCEGWGEEVDGKPVKIPDFLVCQVSQDVRAPDGTNGADYIAGQLNKASDLDRLADAFREARAEFPLPEGSGAAVKRQALYDRLSYIATVLDPMIDAMLADDGDVEAEGADI